MKIRHGVPRAMNMLPVLVTPMCAEDVPLVFPLVRQRWPGLCLADWMKIARRLVHSGRDGTRGFLLARYDGALHPCGAVQFQREIGQEGAAMLTVEQVSVLTHEDPAAVVLALARAAERHAARLGCIELRFLLSTTDGSLSRPLAGAGFSHGGCVVIKRMAAINQDVC